MPRKRALFFGCANGCQALTNRSEKKNRACKHLFLNYTLPLIPGNLPPPLAPPRGHPHLLHRMLHHPIPNIDHRRHLKQEAAAPTIPTPNAASSVRLTISAPKPGRSYSRCTKGLKCNWSLRKSSSRNLPIRWH